MDLEADGLDVAEALGFASFGSQARPQKKRRYNPHADAATAVTSPAERQTSRPTGANTMPLATERVMGKNRTANKDEIDLEDEDESEDGAGDAAADTRPPGGPAEVLSSSSTTTTLPGGRPVGLPQRPAAGAGYTSSAGGQDRRRGERFEGYYDPKSNENPWARLERAKGLRERGNWTSPLSFHEPMTT